MIMTADAAIKQFYKVKSGDISYEHPLHNSLSISSSINHTIRVSPVLHIRTVHSTVRIVTHSVRKDAEDENQSSAFFDKSSFLGRKALWNFHL